MIKLPKSADWGSKIYYEFISSFVRPLPLWKEKIIKTSGNPVLISSSFVTSDFSQLLLPPSH